MSYKASSGLDQSKDAKAQYYKRLAFFGLIAIQVTIGIVYKLSQVGGKYTYNPASALVVAEFMKMTISVVMMLKVAGGPGASSLPTRRDMLQLENRPLLGTTTEKAQYVRSELTKVHSSKVLTSLFCLAALYAINNNLTFIILERVDPGTLNLVKSGATLVSACILYLVLKRKINTLQWLAIAIQTCALIISQYDACKGSTIYPVPSYIIMLFALSITCVTGVWNETILKTASVPLHVVNFYLYAFGVVLNYFIYLYQASQSYQRCVLDQNARQDGDSTRCDANGFFAGYTPAAYLIIFCNSIIGIVITAVYKYADVVIKNIASSVSTACLYSISIVFFGATAGLQTTLGYGIVFLATYLYMLGNTK